MHNIKTTVFLSGLLLAVVALSQCVRPPEYPKEPVIEFIGLSKPSMLQGQYNDSLYITFSFTDGDGDLGYPKEVPTPSIFYRDSRDNFVRDSLQIPQVDPQGAGNGVSGEMTVRLLSTCCIYTSPDGTIKLACDDVPSNYLVDTVYYFITMRDRAGNLSNEIKAGPIYLICHQ